MSLVLASTSPIKIDALSAFGAVTPVVTTTTFCQPLGRAQAEQCLRERLAGLDTAIALENFVEPADGGFVDNCMAAVKKDGIVCVLLVCDDLAVRVPPALADELAAAFDAGELAETVGAKLHRLYGWSATDWFEEAGAAFDRRSQIGTLLKRNAGRLQ